MLRAVQQRRPSPRVCSPEGIQHGDSGASRPRSRRSALEPRSVRRSPGGLRKSGRGKPEFTARSMEARQRLSPQPRRRAVHRPVGPAGRSFQLRVRGNRRPRVCLLLHGRFPESDRVSGKGDDDTTPRHRAVERHRGLPSASRKPRQGQSLFRALTGARAESGSRQEAPCRAIEPRELNTSPGKGSSAFRAPIAVPT